MNMTLETIKTIITIYLSSDPETKQEIKDVLKFLDSLDKTKS